MKKQLFTLSKNYYMKKNLIILIIIAILATIMYFVSGYSQTKIIIPSSSSTDKYQCPKTEWIDCMPGPDKIKSECRPQYLKWAQENCPGFKGAAY